MTTNSGPLTEPAERVRRPLGGPVGVPAMDVGALVERAGGPIYVGERIVQKDTADENCSRRSTTAEDAATMQEGDDVTCIEWTDDKGAADGS